MESQAELWAYTKTRKFRSLTIATLWISLRLDGTIISIYTIDKFELSITRIDGSLIRKYFYQLTLYDTWKDPVTFIVNSRNLHKGEKILLKQKKKLF